MKQTTYETRQRAAELLKEAVKIWRQSDQSDYLEGIENDPVISLLMMAIAYQGNEIDSEIERLKEETLDEFARLLAPYETGHATPASIFVSTSLNKDVAELDTDTKTVFRLSSAHPFIPLLNTRVLNAVVSSVVRIDGRRWKVKLSFEHPIKDLGGFSFAINGLDFRDLTVSIGKRPLSLIKPWDYSELPFSDSFSPQNMLYNRQQVYNMSMLPLDIFARHNVRMFCVDRHNAARMAAVDSDHIELMFEFSGIPDNFPFDKTRIILNAMILVNAQLHETTLTSQKPFDRVAGYSESSTNSDITNRQFMHLLQPNETQLFGKTELEVRRVAADRFNQGRLVALLNSIINKYHSDFYAFQNMKGMETDKIMFNLRESLNALIDSSKEDSNRNVPGVYLLLRDKTQMRNKDFSMSVRYLTTAGAALNGYLNNFDKLSAPSGFDSSLTKVLGAPIQGTDEIDSDSSASTMLRYYILTNDRIVTPSDIKLFCYKELATRYGLSEDMISRIRITRRQTLGHRDCGYEILIEIAITANQFVKKYFANSIPTAEIMLQKMIDVRSSGIYPISVSIDIEDK